MVFQPCMSFCFGNNIENTEKYSHCSCPFSELTQG